MFKTARMKKLSIITLDKYSDSAVSSLHEAGLVQIQDISERIQQDAEWKQILQPSHATPFTGRISSLLMKTTGTIDFLHSVRKREKGMMKMVMGMINPPPIEKKEVETLEVEDLIKKVEKVLSEVESKTKPHEDNLNQLDSEKAQLENAHKVAENLTNFNIDLADLSESEYVSVIVGKISNTSFEKFKENLKNLTDEIELFDTDAALKEFKILIVITRKQYGDEVTSQLRKLEFERYEFPGVTGKPSDIIKNAESRIESIEKEKKDILSELAVISAQWKPELTVLKEQLEIEKQRSEIYSSFGQTQNTVMLEGWVMAKKLDKAIQIIEDSTEGHSVIDVSDPDVEKDDIPVHLDNPKFAKPYESFVHMYSTPTYREFDPTILMAIVFPFFFGFCLTDAGYGIIDALIGVVLYKGLGKTNKFMGSFGLVLIACGVWAFILGMVTNGFIGDFFPRWILGGAPLPTTIGLADAFVHPEIILVIALIVGVIHINMGLVIGAYNNIVRGDTREALGAQIVWFVLEAGIVALVAAFLLTGNMMTAGIVGGPIIALSLIMLIYFNGAFGLMDLTGFLGTLLSYARLLALCLSTGGIAMTVNILTGLVGDMIPYIGIILAPIVFIGGHIANMAFQSLGAFINSLRLHYVEYFAQFYIGGSQKFRAFRAKRKYTDLGGK
ncbi:MAG: V-type ATP synthase subunit I [Methanobacterium sp.]|nr:V-type ATP synthase subunit I [Methanobacterium sp.]